MRTILVRLLKRFVLGILREKCYRDSTDYHSLSSEQTMKLSIVIPVFNEEVVIETANSRIISLIENLLAKGDIDDYEVIYVDDGSKDNSLSILKKLSSLSNKIKILSFSRNFGHQPALAAGIVHSSGDAVVSIDADMQDPPELIGKMIEKYRQGNHIFFFGIKEWGTDYFFKKFTG